MPRLYRVVRSGARYERSLELLRYAKMLRPGGVTKSGVMVGIGEQIVWAMLGAIVFMLAQDYISALNPAYWQFWIGLLLVVIVLFARGGILGGLDKLQQRLTRKRPGERA